MLKRRVGDAEKPRDGIYALRGLKLMLHSWCLFEEVYFDSRRFAFGVDLRFFLRAFGGDLFLCGFKEAKICRSAVIRGEKGEIFDD